ncbi:MAG: DUF4411 family protein [Burkholderiaceae bacterium]|nr:DUF4411 family protein [Rhodoferax sp.]MBP6647411.1 DUF4411 family protein [Burkholderiaceae bacterium]
MTIYCIDTSTIIDAGERYYPIDIFPAFWEKLDGLIQAGRLKAPQTLIDELENKDDAWREWVYSRKSIMIWPIDEPIQTAMSRVMPVYVETISNLNSVKGDPFFIAASIAHHATLITSEKLIRGSIKIPKICDRLGVKWSPLLNVVRAEGWQF